MGCVPILKMVEQLFKYLIGPVGIGVGKRAFVYSGESKVIPAGDVCREPSHDVPKAVLLCNLRI